MTSIVETKSEIIIESHENLGKIMDDILEKAKPAPNLADASKSRPRSTATPIAEGQNGLENIGQSSSSEFTQLWTIHGSYSMAETQIFQKSSSRGERRQ
jgi:hypothetical protein